MKAVTARLWAYARPYSWILSGSVFLVGVVGATDSAIEAYPHVWVRMGEVGKLFAALKARAIAEMVIIGAMTRPEFADLRLDWGAVKRVAGLAQLFRRGDNGLLAGIAAIIEREGVRVVGAHEVAPRHSHQPYFSIRRPRRGCARKSEIDIY